MGILVVKKMGILLAKKAGGLHVKTPKGSCASG